MTHDPRGTIAYSQGYSDGVFRRPRKLLANQADYDVGYDAGDTLIARIVLHRRVPSVFGVQGI